MAAAYPSVPQYHALQRAIRRAIDVDNDAVLATSVSFVNDAAGSREYIVFRHVDLDPARCIERVMDALDDDAGVGTPAEQKRRGALIAMLGRVVATYRTDADDDVNAIAFIRAVGKRDRRASPPPLLTMPDVDDTLELRVTVHKLSLVWARDVRVLQRNVIARGRVPERSGWAFLHIPAVVTECR